MSKPVKTGPKKNKTAEKNPLMIHTPFPTFMGHRNFADNEAFNERLRLNIYRNRGQNPEGTTRSNTAGT